MDDSVVTEDLRLTENICLAEVDWLVFDLEAPILGYLHISKHFGHVLDVPDSFSRINLRLHERLAHTWTFANTLGYVCKKATLWWQIVVLTVGFDNEHGLSHIANFHLVCLLEVISDCYFLTVAFKHVCWSFAEVDTIDDVSLLCTPVSHDALSCELDVGSLLPLVLVTVLLPKLNHLVKDGLGRDKLECLVDSNRKTELSVLD